ncbi:MAG: tetraacyldisaccharide 4'-kinase [Negativicutes bacterium]|jgi:tetraacyldisaccharide 4'-kinase
MTRKETLSDYLFAVIKGKKTGFGPSLFLTLMTWFSWIYYAVIWSLCALYRCGLFSKQKLPCFVVSLGNITVGGTGKTPTAERMATEFLERGYKVAILNRGYRGTWRGIAEIVSNGEQMLMTAQECGDEAYLLAANLPGVGVVIGRDRYTSGLLAIKEYGAEVLILDDAFQHWQLARDLDIVLIDATDDLLNNHILPRGTLREPRSGLKRATMFFVTKTEHADQQRLEEIKEYLARINPAAPIIETNHKPAGFIEIEDWYAGKAKAILPTDTIYGQKILAFSALGNPASFEHTIVSLGGEVYQRVRFPDHHSYSMAEMQRILIRAVASGVSALVTTEKDAVKIPSEFIHRFRKLPIYVLKIQVFSNEEAEYDIVRKKVFEMISQKKIELEKEKRRFD